MQLHKTSAERQEEILSFLKKFIMENGYAPSTGEIAKGVGLKSTSTVHLYLKKLEERGLIQRRTETHRAIEPVLQRSRGVQVPLVGETAAGMPLYGEQNIEGVYELPQEFVATTEETFLLRVHGDSMINVGIYDGDLVLVKRQQYAGNGDIVAVWVEDEGATVKRFFKEDGRIRLQPENDSMQPFYRQDVRIMGLVIGLMRKM